MTCQAPDRPAVVRAIFIFQTRFRMAEHLPGQCFALGVIFPLVLINNKPWPAQKHESRTTRCHCFPANPASRVVYPEISLIVVVSLNRSLKLVMNNFNERVGENCVCKSCRAFVQHDRAANAVIQKTTRGHGRHTKCCSSDCSDKRLLCHKCFESRLLFV